MKNSLKINPKTRLSMRQIAAVTSVFATLVVVFIVIFNIGKTEKTFASTNETLSAGSYIIDMGIVPQTVSNGLKPYGLIYDLINNYGIPVKWIIEPSKAKDGTDFIYNGYSYKGGPFIIPAEFINPTIASVISNWNSSGVQGTYTTTDITVPVYHTIVSYPKVMIDTLSTLQSIVEAYYSQAGIPSGAYTFGTPSSLNECFDLWTNPHGDPTWETHGNLYNFVVEQKSFIWAQCHSVSMMEACRNPSNSSQSLAFLSTTGLQCYQSNGNKCPGIGEAHLKSSTSPYTYNNSADPVMQFMGNMHGATKTGSEQWFIPITEGQWHSNVAVGVTTSQGASPRQGTLLTYGPAFGNTSNGYAMYEGGHDLFGAGTTEEQVAAVRAYHNYVLLAGKLKQFSGTLDMASSVQPGGVANAVATPIAGTPPYSYEWSANIGTFNNTTYYAVNYTAPSYDQDTTIAIRVVITDACNRKTILYKYLSISGGALPVELTSFSATRNTSGVALKWTTASEKNNDFFTVERAGTDNKFSPVIKVVGKGNTHTGHNYAATDHEAPKSQLYYRLKQTDIDGGTSTFRTISVKSENAASGTISALGPNPFTDQIIMTVES